MEHMRCVKATDMAIVLFEITHNLKRTLESRFESQPQPRDEFDGIEEAFREIYKLMDEHGINLDELIQ
jgi:DNA polymerase I-like protein with 3'-5' exonuclease and polymerase domains